ncbi:putative cell wall anchor protein [Streptococcus intermedius]|uniref:Cell wall anchor protein n=1 Tax=Streptococcus intermedius TaxID=1338 RepID=A0AAD1C6C1_STRIT|nr:GbpC/Spa domain-containing protein [Streptococcus intermedius]BAW16073.1 putative cell wall anchor protein [Streptococcus intermedius]BAW17070.1 putative cell wall anchor protein [Streptococcus intermedius]
MKSKKTKTYGSIRKIKAYGTCGVILGLAALTIATSQTSYADQLTDQTQPKQELVTNSTAGTVRQAQLKEAVTKAKNEGVKVVQDPTVDKGTVSSSEVNKVQAEIAADQAQQAAQIDQTTTDYVKEKAEHEKAVAAVKQQNAQIEAENKVLQEAHDKAAKAGQETNQAAAAAKEKVKAEFKDAQVSESSKTIPVDPTSKESYDHYTKEVEKVKADNQQATDTYLVEKRKENKEIEDTKAYNEAVRKRNAAGKAKVEAENKEIDAFNKQVAEYNQAEKERFEKEKAQAEKDKIKDGHLSEVATQGLVFKDEVNAQVSVKGVKSYLSAEGLKKAFEDITRNLGASDLQQYVTYFAQTFGDDLKITNDPSRLSSHFELYTPQGGNVYSNNKFGAVNAKVGQTVTVTYDKLEHSFYKGKPISRMELDVTVQTNSENIQEDVVIGVSQNPAKGIEIAARYQDKTKDYKLNVSLKPRFYDQNGQLIVFEDQPNETKGLLSISSLNAYKNHVETMRPSDTARFIPISGSSIVKHGNGLVYSNEEDNSNGHHFGLDGHNIIDHTESPYFWYLAGAVALKGGNPEYGLTITSWDKLGDRKGEGRFTPSIWFTVTSNVVASGVPIAPTYKTPKEHKTFTPEPEKTVPTPKVKLSLVTVNSVPEPTLKPKGKEPTPPKAPTVHYHLHRLTVKPEAPQPKKPIPAPKAQVPALPQTGTASSVGLSVLGMILAGFGLFGLKKRNEVK